MTITPPPWNAAQFEKAKELFLEVLDRPAGERMAFLVVACHGDDALRTEVESLLEFHQPASPAPRPGAPAFVTGNLVGDRYRPRSSVGTIAESEAWSGWDLLDDRDVTLLLIREPDRESRPAIEARLRLAAAPLPSVVVAVLDVVDRRDGLVVVLGDIVGVSLESWRSQQFGAGAADVLVDDLLAAMAALHARGLALGGFDNEALRVDAAGRGAIVPLPRLESAAMAATENANRENFERDFASIERLANEIRGDSAAVSVAAGGLASARPPARNIFELSARLGREPLEIARRAGFVAPNEAFLASRISPRIGRAPSIALAIAGLSILLVLSKLARALPDNSERFLPIALVPLSVLLALMGIEPLLRRRRPAFVIAWRRILAGRPFDLFVASELAVGALAGEVGALAVLALSTGGGGIRFVAAVGFVVAALAIAARGFLAAAVASAVFGLFLFSFATRSGMGAFTAGWFLIFAIVGAIRGIPRRG